jgi:hypothetical protein
VDDNPSLLRRRFSRPTFRRFVLVAAMIGMLLVAPSAGGVPGDQTPPVVTPLFSPSLPANGWFRSNVTLNWSYVDPESIITSTVGCDSKTLTADTAGTQFTCSVTSDGGTTTVTRTVRVDKSLPSVTAAPERLPDANGWYNRGLTVAFSGTDATSGIASCSPAAHYAGPDNPAASTVGSCTDNAGNVASASLAFKYDATPPSLFAVTTKRGNRSAEVSWRKSTDTNVVEVVRAPGRGSEGESVVYRGSETGFRDTGLVVGRKYDYRVIGFDEAMNRAEHKLALVATGPLLSPAPGEQVKSPPTLVWTRVKKASYYNVQLIRGGRRVLSAWPVRPSFRLPRTWLYKGRRYRLRPGAYRWYVWPGFGRITAARYARQPLGSSTFVVAK